MSTSSSTREATVKKVLDRCLSNGEPELTPGNDGELGGLLMTMALRELMAQGLSSKALESEASAVVRELYRKLQERSSTA